MEKSTFSFISIVFLAGLALQSCQRSASTFEMPKSSQVAAVAKEDVKIHSITLPQEEVDFPAGAGKQIFVARCNVCHTLRYISMQPDFPEKTWEKEVDKMRKTFGAHCSDAEAKEIVAYLMLVKGRK
ncbi:MAG: cytochrome c [Candidatus Obscuribacterales bacterium]|nr:cytochrome c [Candidatus Obscuribacterales bacterium]